jgi:hypothetical protein
MVILHKIQPTTGGYFPVVPRHQVTVARQHGPFRQTDEAIEVFIQKMSCGRYGVIENGWKSAAKYAVFTEKELHETFNELL